MKVTVEIDTTPQEMRTLMGMPDVETLQQEVMDKMRERVMTAMEANDMTELMKLFIPSTEQFKSMEAMQASFWKAFSQDLNLFAVDKGSKE